MRVKIPDPADFLEQITERTQPKPLDEIATDLVEYYNRRDRDANKDFMRTAAEMFAHYEDRWWGAVDEAGRWQDYEPNHNETGFSVPLLTAHVDTHVTFYTKAEPKYVAEPFIASIKNKRLAKMCETIANRELTKLLTPVVLQHEAQYIDLATVSYRQIRKDVSDRSPAVTKFRAKSVPTQVYDYECDVCGKKEGTEEQGEYSCPDCAGDMKQTGMRESEKVMTEPYREKLPRPALDVPNPVSVQRDFSASDFDKSSFIIKRKKVPKKWAEYYYQIDLSSEDSGYHESADVPYDEARRPLIDDDPATRPTISFSHYLNQQSETVTETEMWLQPCEYAMIPIVQDDGTVVFLGELFPNGLYLHVCGNYLVKARPAQFDMEWVQVQSGVRPSANTGMGMVPLAHLNDFVNNAVSLDYSVARTHGFPIRLFRGKYFKELPQALQQFFINTISDDQPLDDLIHTEQPSQASGMLGILTQQAQGFMQYIGGSLNPQGLTSDMREVMGTATGASAMQQMMSDRMGLTIQMRVLADIKTIYAVLYMYAADEGNRELFLDEFDEASVDAFFDCDFKSEIDFRAAKGSDQPKLESVDTFKAQVFTQNAAAMTGIAQYNPALYYDLISSLGDSMNFPVEIGTGRKERNIAQSRIAMVQELYKEEKDNELYAQIEVAEFGKLLYEAVTANEQNWFSQIAQSLIPTVPQEEELDAQTAAAILQQTQSILIRLKNSLFDYKALVEAYSDWLQSDAAQSSDIPVQVAIGYLYAEAAKAVMEMEDLQRQQAMEMAMAGEMGKKADQEAARQEADQRRADQQQQNEGAQSKKGESIDNPPGALKRDGQVGPGRPREPKVMKAES